MLYIDRSNLLVVEVDNTIFRHFMHDHHGNLGSYSRFIGIPVPFAIRREFHILNVVKQKEYFLLHNLTINIFTPISPRGLIKLGKLKYASV